MLYIGKMRELFWDNYIIDTDKTTASLKLHSPIRRECVLVHDEPWEGDGSDYHNFFKDKNGIYRMYYLGWQTMNPDKTQHTIDDICICYAESTDGINWSKTPARFYVSLAVQRKIILSLTAAQANLTTSL